MTALTMLSKIMHYRRALFVVSIVGSLTASVGLGCVLAIKEATRVRKYVLENDARYNAELKRHDAEIKRASKNMDGFYAQIEVGKVPVVLIDKDGVVTVWNKVATDTFGWEAKDVVGKSLEFLMPPDKVSKGHHDAFVAGPSVVDKWVEKQHGLECWMLTKSGRYEHVYIQAYMADHPPSRYIAFIHNPKGGITKVPKPE